MLDRYLVVTDSGEVMLGDGYADFENAERAAKRLSGMMPRHKDTEFDSFHEGAVYVVHIVSVIEREKRFIHRLARGGPGDAWF